MSTRSNIILAVNQEDIGKIITPDKTKLYTKGIRFEDVDSNSRISEQEIDKFEPVKITGKFMIIYHHWDGYPEGVGETLINSYNTYEDVLNLLTYGDESTINEKKVMPYSIRGGQYRKSEYTPARFENRIPDDLEKSSWAEYVYLFINGEWLFSSTYHEDGAYHWESLQEHLNNERS